MHIFKDYQYNGVIYTSAIWTIFILHISINRVDQVLKKFSSGSACHFGKALLYKNKNP